MSHTTLATVEFAYRDATRAAVLTHDGWSISGPGSSFARTLNTLAATSRFGPADGDPVACAAHAAADVLDGDVTFVRPAPPVPAGTVY